VLVSARDDMKRALCEMRVQFMTIQVWHVLYLSYITVARTLYTSHPVGVSHAGHADQYGRDRGAHGARQGRPVAVRGLHTRADREDQDAGGREAAVDPVRQVRARVPRGLHPSAHRREGRPRFPELHLHGRHGQVQGVPGQVLARGPCCCVALT